MALPTVSSTMQSPCSPTLSLMSRLPLIFTQRSTAALRGLERLSARQQAATALLHWLFVTLQMLSPSTPARHFTSGGQIPPASPRHSLPIIRQSNQVDNRQCSQRGSRQHLQLVNRRDSLLLNLQDNHLCNLQCDRPASLRVGLRPSLRPNRRESQRVSRLSYRQGSQV